ncbi:MAG: PDZ domain-containing protein [Cyanobacteria bacterium SZAS LIN-2]|nr:PDZ domain-containing protein [Cyanobacteria bacterium SZAS LIN-2]
MTKRTESVEIARVANKVWGARLCLAALLCLGMVAGSPGMAEEQPVLKPDVPKFDNAPPAASTHVLKGNLIHHAKIAPAKPKPRPKRLNSRLDRQDSAPLNGLMKGQADGTKPFSLGEKSTTLRSEVQQPYTLERSVGIIGIKFMKVGGEPPLVNRVFPGTPAYKMGFSVNDTIVAVDGVPTYGLTKDECYDLIVGTPNTPITVTLLHRGNFEVKNMMRMDFNEIPDPLVRRDYLNSL